MFEVFFKFYSCNEDIKPSAAFSCGHIKYKIHAQECTKTRHFYFKNSKIFWEGGTVPSPDPSPAGGGHPLLHPPPRRLRRLDLRAFGAHSRTPHSELWLRACSTQITAGGPKVPIEGFVTLDALSGKIYLYLTRVLYHI